MIAGAEGGVALMVLYWVDPFEGELTEWGEYELFYFPGQAGVPHYEMSKGEAREFFEFAMREKGARIGRLVELASLNGYVVDESDAGVQRLNDFFVEHVTGDPSDVMIPRGRWLSVGYDISLFLGEIAVSRVPELRWDLVTKPRNVVGFQEPAVWGYVDYRGKEYFRAIFRNVTGYANEITIWKAPAAVRAAHPQAQWLDDSPPNPSHFLKVLTGMQTDIEPPEQRA